MKKVTDNIPYLFDKYIEPYASSKVLHPPKKKTIRDDNTIKTSKLYSEVRAILCKISLQNFHHFETKIQILQIDDSEKINGVVNILFEKAIEDLSISEVCAEICKVLLHKRVLPDKENHDHAEFVFFRQVLVSRVQHEFEKDRNVELKRDEKLKDIEASEDAVKKRLMEMLYNEVREIHLKYIGTVIFISKLFKVKILTSSIIQRVIKQMLSEADETSLEGLFKLLTAIGRDLESMLDLEPIFDMIKKFCFNFNILSNKVRLMMVKLVNLRIRMWDPNHVTVNKIIFEADKKMSDELAAQNLTTEIAREKKIAKDTTDKNKNVKEKVMEIESSKTKLNDQFSSSTSSFSCTPNSSGDEISLSMESKYPQNLKYTSITVKEPANQSNKESILCTKVAKKTLLVYSSEDEIPLKSKLNKDKHSKSSETMVKCDILNPPVSDCKPRRDQISNKRYSKLRQVKRLQDIPPTCIDREIKSVNTTMILSKDQTEINKKLTDKDNENLSDIIKPLSPENLYFETLKMLDQILGKMIDEDQDKVSQNHTCDFGIEDNLEKMPDSLKQQDATQSNTDFINVTNWFLNGDALDGGYFSNMISELCVSDFVDKSLQEKMDETLESLLKDYLNLSNKSSTKEHTIGLNNALGVGESTNGKFDNLNESGCSSVFLERKLAEEKKWLQTTRKRMIDLKDMRSQEYDTYLYMNQSLSSEVTLHHGLTTHFMNEASKLHEEDIFHGLDLHLEDVIQFQGQVDATIHRLMLFREHWSLYLLCVSRLERWIKKAQEIRVELDMKVQLNANLAILNSASQYLEFAISSVPLSDASEHVQQLSQLQEYIHCLKEHVGGGNSSQVIDKLQRSFISKAGCALGELAAAARINCIEMIPARHHSHNHTSYITNDWPPR
uniref:MIF4G domain-containing protein n=1 Tax=Timema bartmani TaxID=61472 RepID=A0A7R9I1N8_9NEOP|nr:unnamed protein product [Timema bartmani]